MKKIVSYVFFSVMAASSAFAANAPQDRSVLNTLSSAPSTSKLIFVGLKNIDSGSALDLSFDRHITAKMLHPEYEKNFIQFVLKKTRLDAAKVIPLSSSSIVKVFAYPYDPTTVRVRVYLKDDVTSKPKISLWNSSAKTIRIHFKGTEVAATKAASAAAVTAATTEEQALLKEVISATKEVDLKNPATTTTMTEDDTKSIGRESKEETKDSGPVGVKAEPSKGFVRMALALFAVLSVFIGAVWGLKKYAVKLDKLPFNKKERLIQVVATQYLGNKKNISLVKVANEYMVVGVGSEGISLISKLGADINVDKYLEDRFWGGTFEKHLGSYAKDVKSKKTEALADVFEPQPVAVTHALPVSSFRQNIRAKVGNLKPLV